MKKNPLVWIAIAIVALYSYNHYQAYGTWL
jgi:hypothetical protein